MKRVLILTTLVAVILLAATYAFAQEATESAATTAPTAQGTTFFDIVLSSGLFGVLLWFGILFWGIASIPLGILSIVHSSTCHVRQLPLTTKLLILGGIWVFILGAAGFIQGTIYSLFCLGAMEGGASQQAMLAMNTLHALYSMSTALVFCQIILLFLLVSLVILHFKHRKMLA